MMLQLFFTEIIKLVVATNNAKLEFKNEYEENREYIRYLIENSPYNQARLDTFKQQESLSTIDKLGKNTPGALHVLNEAMLNNFYLKEEYLDFVSGEQSLHTEIECMIFLYNKLDAMFENDLMEELKNGAKCWFANNVTWVQPQAIAYSEFSLCTLLKVVVHCFNIATRKLFFYCKSNDSFHTYLNRSLSTSTGFKALNAFDEANYKKQYVKSILSNNLDQNLYQSMKNLECLFVPMCLELIENYGLDSIIKPICYNYNICTGLLKSFGNFLISIQNMLLNYMFLKDIHNNQTQEQIQACLEHFIGTIREINVDLLLMFVDINEVLSFEELDVDNFNIFEYVFNEKTIANTFHK